MKMFEMHKELNQFYQDHVRLGEERKTLAKHRDINLERLHEGLEQLGYPSNFEHRNQGSYAMHTINQQPNKDYDIDVAVIFDKEDLPENALDAKKRMEASMQEAGGNFSQPPEAKTNAVRVYYSEGHHVDMAIYRKCTDEYGNLIHEHAGSEWTVRDPMEITNWFNDIVRKCSPSNDVGMTVEENQMRRIVRWLKVFAKSREHWDLPGGLIISVLVAECYKPNFTRDDISLYETMVSIRDRLKLNEDVWNPVYTDQILSDRPVDQGRIKRFRDKLDTAISKLAALHESECKEDQARQAWYWVFQNKFWSTDDTSESQDALGKRLGEAALKGSIFVNSGGRVFTEKPEGTSIQAPPQRFYGEE
jgi:hypothetical protein